MTEQGTNSAFRKTRELEDQNKVGTYIVLILFIAISVYFAAWKHSYLGIIFATGAATMILIRTRLTDRATYVLGLVLFAIAGGLAYAHHWPGSQLTSSVNLVLGGIAPGLWWAIQYRKAIWHNTQTK